MRWCSGRPRLGYERDATSTVSAAAQRPSGRGGARDTPRHQRMPVAASDSGMAAIRSSRSDGGTAGPVSWASGGPRGLPDGCNSLKVHGSFPFCHGIEPRTILRLAVSGLPRGGGWARRGYILLLVRTRRHCWGCFAGWCGARQRRRVLARRHQPGGHCAGRWGGSGIDVSSGPGCKGVPLVRTPSLPSRETA